MILGWMDWGGDTCLGLGLGVILVVGRVGLGGGRGEGI